MNEALERRGIEAVETDLGKFPARAGCNCPAVAGSRAIIPKVFGTSFGCLRTGFDARANQRFVSREVADAEDGERGGIDNGGAGAAAHGISERDDGNHGREFCRGGDGTAILRRSTYFISSIRESEIFFRR
jgi:hypothetical protein